MKRIYYVAVPVEVRQEDDDLKSSIALHLDCIISKSEQADSPDDPYKMEADVTVYTLEDLLADIADGVISVRQPITADERGDVLSNSEAYAHERMAQLTNLRGLTAVHREIVHDALMAGFQAGYLNRAEGLSVDALIARMADIDYGG